MMRSFTYTGLPSRVVFGSGALAALPQEIERLGCRRALVLSTPEQEANAREIATSLGERAAGVFAGAVMHTPVEVSERAVAIALEMSADCTVALGGGSTIGLGKAIALRTDLAQICIPTTYAGSEMTPILGETANGLKTTQRSDKILPEAVIYDVDLTLTLPPALSATSGINAIAHAVEALYAQDRNPIISLMAEEGVRRPRSRAAADRRKSAQWRGPRRRALRRMAMRGMPRRGGDGAASQALPHAGRHLQPAACRDAHDRVAACAGL